MAWPDWPWPPYVTTNLRHCVETSVVIKPRALVFSIAVMQDNLPFGWFYNECLYLCWPLSRICRFRFFSGFFCGCVRVDIQKWSAVLGLACIIAVAPLSSICPASLHIIGAAVGFPAGLCVLHTVIVTTPSLSFTSSVCRHYNRLHF